MPAAFDIVRIQCTIGVARGAMRCPPHRNRPPAKPASQRTSPVDQHAAVSTVSVITPASAARHAARLETVERSTLAKIVNILSSVSLRFRACRRYSYTRDNSTPPRCCGSGWLPGYAYIRSAMHACMHTRQSKSRSHRSSSSNQQLRSLIITSQPCRPCLRYDYYDVLRERRTWWVRHGAIGINSDLHGNGAANIFARLVFL
jgi:hypothetical protein